MPTFVMLLNFTQQGAETIKEAPDRVEGNMKAAAAMGIEIKSVHALMGEYDWLVVMEAPDSATVSKLALAASSRGSVTTKTMPAFSMDEFRAIVADLP